MEENLTIQERWNKIPKSEKAKMMFLIKKSQEVSPKESKKNILKMNRLIIKIVLAIAIGVLVGTVLGNLESNKEVAYFHVSFEKEISKEAYDMFMKKFKDEGSSADYIVRVLNKKVSFNKELGFYYGAITSSSLVILLLIPSLIKKQGD